MAKPIVQGCVVCLMRLGPSLGICNYTCQCWVHLKSSFWRATKAKCTHWQCPALKQKRMSLHIRLHHFCYVSRRSSTWFCHAALQKKNIARPKKKQFWRKNDCTCWSAIADNHDVLSQFSNRAIIVNGSQLNWRTCKLSCGLLHARLLCNALARGQGFTENWQNQQHPASTRHSFAFGGCSAWAWTLLPVLVGDGYKAACEC